MAICFDATLAAAPMLLSCLMAFWLAAAPLPQQRGCWARSTTVIQGGPHWGWVAQQRMGHASAGFSGRKPSVT